jgi:broad specificity phosphatase PhoE
VTTIIITLRHGTTSFNKLHKIAGWIDCNLDKNGIDQSKLARPFIDKEHFDAIISSTLKRAIQSAILSTGISRSKLIIRKECVERNCGKMQGLLPREVKKIKPKVLYIKVGKYNYSLNPPGGETFYELRLRAEKFVKYLFIHHKGKRVLIISSQAFLQQLHGIFLGLDCYECLRQDILTLEMNSFHFNNLNQMVSKQRKRLSSRGYPSW